MWGCVVWVGVGVSMWCAYSVPRSVRAWKASMIRVAMWWEAPPDSWVLGSGPLAARAQACAIWVLSKLPGHSSCSGGLGPSHQELSSKEGSLEGSLLCPHTTCLLGCGVE